MTSKSLVRFSNIVGSIAIISLIYWIFIFISIEVFGLKVFKENLTETFYMSVLGILGLMFGALILNIMFNLTRIAEKHNQDEDSTTKGKSRKLGYGFVLSFVVILILLFGGDYLSSKQEEKNLIQSAQSIDHDNPGRAEHLVNYSFSKVWINETADILEILSKTDDHYPSVSVIIKDTIKGSSVFLGFCESYENYNDTIAPDKKRYIQETTSEERVYLSKVFDQNYKEIKFISKEGHYELFYPYFKSNKIIVLYFSDYQRYGKRGS